MKQKLETIKEFEETDIDIDLKSEDLNTNIAKYVDIISLDDKKIRLKAKQYVGYLPLTDKVTLRILPKVSTNKFFYILVKSQQNVFFRESRVYENFISDEVDLFKFVVSSLLLELHSLSKYGILKKCITKEENLKCLRGKIRIKENIQQNIFKNKLHYMYCQYYDLTKKIPENEIIKYTLYYILKQKEKFKVEDSDFRKLNHYYKMIDINFSRDKNYILTNLKDILNKRKISPSRYFYYSILNFCLFILENSIILLEDIKTIKFSSFMVNMNVVFEKYILNVLKEKSKGTSIRIAKENKRRLFDNSDEFSFQPDIVIKYEDNVLCIADTKYKKNISEDNLYQIISYIYKMNVKKGILIYPKNGNENKEFNLKDKNIICYFYDLEQPKEMENQLYDFVKRVIEIS